MTNARSSRWALWRMVAMAVVAPVFCTPGAWAQVVSGGRQELRLTSGMKATYSYRYDRNAIVGAELGSDSLVAITKTGNLLKFDLGTLKLVQERVSPVGYTCIGRSHTGAIIVGGPNAVEEVNLDGLTTRKIADLPGTPSWLGADRAGKTIIAVLLDRDDSAGWTRAVAALAWDVVAKRGFALPRDRNGGASAFFIDGKSRLWIGADHGEWGGWCNCLDLRTGEMQPIAGDDLDGIYGFVPLGDNGTLAYGGMMHFDGEAFVGRIVGDKVAGRPYDTRRDMPRERVATTQPATRPTNPITHIVAHPTTGELVVFAYSDVFLVDPAFKNWRRLATLRVHYAPGRPDAMGVYPAVTSVHVLPGAPMRIICTTRSDGIIEILGSKVVPHTLGGEPGFDAKRVFGTVGDGVVIGTQTSIFGDYELSVVDGSGSRRLEMALPDAGSAGVKVRRAYPVHLARDVLTLAFRGGEPDLLRVVAWRNGKAEALFQGDRGLELASIFQTPDGKLWGVRGDMLGRLENGEWRAVCKAPERFAPVYRVVNRGRSPWLVFALRGMFILEQAHDGSAQLTELRAITPEGKTAKWIFDGLETADGSILLATSEGLFAYNGKDKPLSRPTIAVPNKFISGMCEDFAGRIWFSGADLWVLDPRTKRLEMVEGISPLVGRNAVGLAPCGGESVMVFLEDGDYLIVTMVSESRG